MRMGIAVVRLVLPYLAGAMGAFVAGEYTGLFNAFCQGAS